MHANQLHSGQRRCFGRTQNLHRCGRTLEGRFFCQDHRKQPLVWGFAFLFTILPGLLAYFDFFQSPYGPSLEQSIGQKGEVVQKATLTGFEKEVQKAAEDLAARATVQFKAAEDDYTERRYKAAAERYQNSIDLLPTMSAYLNYGNTLLNISEFAQAEVSYLAGLQLARKETDKPFEASFLGNIGIVYADQGNYEEALRAHQDALTLHKQLGNPLGQANTLTNIGSVYADQGKYEEALRASQDALTFFKQLGNPLGQANTLTDIGIAYFHRFCQGSRQIVPQLPHIAAIVLPSIQYIGADANFGAKADRIFLSNQLRFSSILLIVYFTRGV